MKTQRKELPPVDKGVPLPLIKYHPNTRSSCSRWAGYLKKLEPGDSFVIQKGETQTVMIQAKRLGLFVTWRVIAEGVRVWLVPEDKIPVKPKRLWLKGEKRQVDHPKPKKEQEQEPAFTPLDVSLL